MSYDAELYMHDLDRKAFAALNQFPKFVKLQEAYIANVNEKAAKIELAWIKTTEKPYLTIEAMVNELADRKNVIFESVKDLILL